MKNRISVKIKKLAEIMMVTNLQTLIIEYHLILKHKIPQRVKVRIYIYKYNVDSVANIINLLYVTKFHYKYKIRFLGRSNLNYAVDESGSIITSAGGLGASSNNPETGSIITMTSDERVQIFVPSPSGGGTPYRWALLSNVILRINISLF